MNRTLRTFLLAALGAAVPVAVQAAPVPEVEQDVLFIHDIARDFVPQLGGVAEIMSDGFSPKGYMNPNVGWVRDRYPLQARGAAGELAVVSYLSWANEGCAAVELTYNIPGMSVGNGNRRVFQLGKEMCSMELRRLPLILEGGNVIGTAGHLFISEKILAENAKTKDQHLEPYQGDMRIKARNTLASFEQFGWRPRSRDEVLGELARAFDLTVDRVVVLPWMPGERTGHVDLYLGLLTADTLAIPTIPAELIGALGYDHERQFARGIQAFLDERASQVTAATGGAVKVVRLPMLPPKNLTQSSLSSLGWDAQFPTPVNWVFHGGRAYVPDFPDFFAHVPQSDRMHAEIRSCLEGAGYQVEFLPVRDLLSHAGLIHCLTAKLKRPPR